MGMTSHCNCIELLDRNEQRMNPTWIQYHDCDYVAKREALIPEAIDNVNQRSGKTSGARWTRMFAAEMEELVKKAKLLR